MFQALKQIKHRMGRWRWLLGGRQTTADFYAEAIISIACRWEGEVQPLLTYTAMFDVLRQRQFNGSFWELGGGYSTILAPLSLGLSLNQIYSVDFNPDKYHRILNAKRNTHKFLSKINLMSQITVSLEQVEQGVNLICDRLEAFEADELHRTLTKYGYQTPMQNIGYVGWKSELLKDFWNHDAANVEKAFYENFDAMTGEGLCSQIAADRPQIDALFLDCGELSSVAEFVLLEPILQPGSFLLLHDIRYPKSIKNFLVATYLELCPDWEVIYTDFATQQGGMVAKRRENRGA
jgi:predicted O-methyltransferase YrrM